MRVMAMLDRHRGRTRAPALHKSPWKRPRSSRTSHPGRTDHCPIRAIRIDRAAAPVIIMSHAAHRGHGRSRTKPAVMRLLDTMLRFGHAQVEWDCATKGYAMNDLLIIDMLPTYGLLFYLLISVFVFVGCRGLRRRTRIVACCVFAVGAFLVVFRARRRVRCAGVYHGSAFGATGYGRLLPHVPARSSDLPAGIVHHTICLRRRCRVSGESNLVYPAINALADTCCLSVNCHPR